MLAASSWLLIHIFGGFISAVTPQDTNAALSSRWTKGRARMDLKGFDLDMISLSARGRVRCTGGFDNGLADVSAGCYGGLLLPLP
jgi:hypothetical protein